MRILDLFCGAGGAAVGYHRAFPNAEIVGVDINPQKNYPFEFHQADAMAYPLEGFDLIHASPPCQDHSVLKTMHDGHGTGWMLAATIERLRASGAHWVVENVPGSEAAIGEHVRLCGSAFKLQVRRHRLFATSLPVNQPACRHRDQGQPIGVYGTGGGGQMTRGRKGNLIESKAAMRIDWMNRAEISQAIPPIYTHYIGCQIREAMA